MNTRKLEKLLKQQPFVCIDIEGDHPQQVINRTKQGIAFHYLRNGGDRISKGGGVGSTLGGKPDLCEHVRRITKLPAIK